MPRTPSLDRNVLEAALVGLELQQQRLERQIDSIRGTLGKRRPGRPRALKETPVPAKRRRRRMSVEGRKRIAEAQRKRWAKLKKRAK